MLFDSVKQCEMLFDLREIVDTIAHTMRTRQRTFRRDAYFGFRLPSEDKARLNEVARKKRRDASSLALEWVSRGLEETERELSARR